MFECIGCKHTAQQETICGGCETVREEAEIRRRAAKDAAKAVAKRRPRKTYRPALSLEQIETVMFTGALKPWPMSMERARKHAKRSAILRKVRHLIVSDETNG